ncbi:MAG: cyclodeaminase/cyclohydrolase family protein [Thermomicrobiales bacterium]
MSAETQRTLIGYIAEVASAAPAPGGGSVAAVVGALGAALGQMVLNLTPAPTDAEAAAQYAAQLAALAASQARLLELAAADEAAYQTYRDAAALPRATPEAKAARTAAMQAALVQATETPLAMAEEAASLADRLVEVAQVGNRHLLTDAALAALLAEVTLRGALLNVRGNAGMLKDAARAGAYQQAADRLEASGRAAAQRAWVLAVPGSGA